MPEAIADERWEKMVASHRTRPGNISAAARAAKANRRTAKKAWEQGYAGRRAIKDIIDEENAVKRSVLAEQDEQRQAEVARIREEILADYQKRMGQLDEREADVQRRLAEYEAVVRDTEARSKRLHAARVECGRADGDSVHEQEAMLLRGNRQMQTIAIELITGTFSPEVVTNLIAAVHVGLSDKSISAKEAVAATRALFSYLKASAEAGEITARTERLVAGAPTSITRTEVALDSESAEAVEGFSGKLEALAEQLREHQRRVGAPAEEAVLELPAPADCQAGDTSRQAASAEDRQVPAETDGAGEPGASGEEST